MNKCTTKAFAQWLLSTYLHGGASLLRERALVVLKLHRLGLVKQLFVRAGHLSLLGLLRLALHTLSQFRHGDRLVMCGTLAACFLLLVVARLWPAYRGSSSVGVLSRTAAASTPPDQNNGTKQPTRFGSYLPSDPSRLVECQPPVDRCDSCGRNKGGNKDGLDGRRRGDGNKHQRGAGIPCYMNCATASQTTCAGNRAAGTDCAEMELFTFASSTPQQSNNSNVIQDGGTP